MSARTNMKIYFENGLVIPCSVDKMTGTARNDSGKLTNLKWDGMEPDVLYMDLTRIVAVVFDA